MEDKQHAMEPTTIGYFPLGAGTVICQIDLAILGTHTSCLNNIILALGIKRILPHTPAIWFVDSIQFENIEILMVQEEGKCIFHGMDQFKWVRQIRVPGIVVIAVNIS